MSCTECKKREAQGPHYNPLRGTGRTTKSLNTALLAAAMGKRVLYVVGLGAHGKELCYHAAELVREAQIDAQILGITERRITFTTGGWLEFRGMSEDMSYRGQKERAIPQLQIWDHYALEKQAEAAAKQARMADCDQVVQLLRKHGFTGVDLLATGGAEWTRERGK